MEELEDIDALINDVPEKREYGETAAQIKVKTFANNFANIGNIGEERRTTQAKVQKTILRSFEAARNRKFTESYACF